MSRVDKPALKCDRCGGVTEDLYVMGRYYKLQHYHQSGSNEWDLCPDCKNAFLDFMAMVA